MHNYRFNPLRKQGRRWLTAAGVGLAISSAAMAQDARPPLPKAEQWPQASLRAEAVTEVSQDTVRITLAHEVSNASQSAVSKALTDALDQSMKQAKAQSVVKATSGNYRIWPHIGKEGKITNWRGRAEIQLESTDFAAASELASALSARMPIADISFSVSDALRSKTEADLLASAVASFRDRAKVLATAFGYADYNLRNVSVSGAGAVYRPMARMAAAPAAAMMEKADVPLEGGTENVSVSVEGSIFLTQKQ